MLPGKARGMLSWVADQTAIRAGVNGGRLGTPPSPSGCGETDNFLFPSPAGEGILRGTSAWDRGLPRVAGSARELEVTVRKPASFSLRCRAAMSENVVKLRCRACAGRIALDEDYYRELIGHTLTCPHCGAEVPVPASAEESDRNVAGMHSVATPRSVERPAGNPRAAAAAGVRKCPFCDDQVGPGDRFCVKCGNKLPPG